MKKIPFAVVKMLNIILLVLPFLGCWGMYYEERTTTVGSKQVTVLVLVTFLVLCYYFCQKLGIWTSTGVNDYGCYYVYFDLDAINSYSKYHTGTYCMGGTMFNRYSMGIYHA